MGVIKDLFKRLFTKGQERLDSGQTNQNNYADLMEEAYGIPVSDTITGETIYFRKCRDVGHHFLYPTTNQKTTIMQAEVYRHSGNPKDTFMISLGKPVCFEVPVGTTLEKLKNSGMLHYMLNQEVASEQNLSPEKVNHIGRIDFQSQNIYPVDSEVAEWVEKNLTYELQQQRKAIRDEQKRKTEARVNENVENLVYQGETARKKERRQRMENPQFTGNPELKMYELNNPENGDIITLTLTGEPTIISHRDGSKDYVYTALRQDRERYTDAMILPSFGANIAFSLPRPIDEMLQFANDKTNSENARNIAQMMENLVIRPKVGNPLFVGAIKERNHSLVFADNNENSIILNLLDWQSKDKSNVADMNPRRNMSQFDR